MKIAYYRYVEKLIQSCLEYLEQDRFLQKLQQSYLGYLAQVSRVQIQVHELKELLSKAMVSRKD